MSSHVCTSKSAGAGWGCALLLRYWHKPICIVFLWVCSNFPLKRKFLYYILYSFLSPVSSLTFSQGGSLDLQLLSPEGTEHWCVIWHLKSLRGKEHLEKLICTPHPTTSPFKEPWDTSPYECLRVVEHCERCQAVGSTSLEVVEIHQDKDMSNLVQICIWPWSQQEVTLDATISPSQPLSLSSYLYLSPSPFFMLSIFFSVSVFSREAETNFFFPRCWKKINGENQHLLKSTV